MSITDLDNIKKFFRSTQSPEQKTILYKEALLMTLARATRADLVTSDSEVETVQHVLQKFLGEEISEADIRVAASSELFEESPLPKYLQRIAPQLEPAQNQAILKGLLAIFAADGQVTESELAYFNMVANALNLTPAEIVGLEVKSP